MNISLPAFTQKPAIIISITQEQPKWQTDGAKESKPEEYYTLPGEYLEKIASEHHMSAQRLFNKNTDIVDPNRIEIGQKLLIPAEEEVLVERPYGTITNTLTASVKQGSPPISGGFSSSGNLYSFGFCTFYAKQMRPDLPNSLGNADTWFSNAASNGFAVSYTPKVGSVAVAINYSHVAIVTAISGDNVTISEMNYIGWNKISSRTAPTGEFRYIY